MNDEADSLDAVLEGLAAHQAPDPAAEGDEQFVLLDFEGAATAEELKDGPVTIDVRLHATSVPHTRPAPERPADASAARTVPQGLDSSAPHVTLGRRIFRATYDEDVGSTLVFDRSRLKRSAEVHARERKGLSSSGPGALSLPAALPSTQRVPTPDDPRRPARAGEPPLVCVTSKRLRMQFVGFAPSVSAAESSSAGTGAGTDGGGAVGAATRGPAAGARGAGGSES